VVLPQRGKRAARKSTASESDVQVRPRQAPDVALQESTRIEVLMIEHIVEKISEHERTFRSAMLLLPFAQLP